MARPIPAETLQHWRSEADRWERLANNGLGGHLPTACQRIATLIDEIERLKAAFIPRPATVDRLFADRTAIRQIVERAAGAEAYDAAKAIGEIRAILRGEKPPSPFDLPLGPAFNPLAVWKRDAQRWAECNPLTAPALLELARQRILSLLDMLDETTR